MSKKKILAIDDDMDMRIFLSVLFETSGYKAYVARDGDEGILKAREVGPDLIILDIMMPGQGGVIMYRRLKSDRDLKNIPVIMLSGVKGKTFSHTLKMLDIGAGERLPEPEAYLEKPPQAEELLKTAEQFLGSAG